MSEENLKKMNINQEIKKRDEIIHQKDLDIYNLKKLIDQKNIEIVKLIDGNMAYFKYKKFTALVSLFKPKRIFELGKNSASEFKRNGIGGIVRRAYYLFVSPRHSMLAYTIDEWEKSKKLKRHSLLDEFVPKKGFISVVIPYIKNVVIPSDKIITQLLQQKYKNFEIIIVVSGFGFALPEELKKFKHKENLKIYEYPAQYSLERIIKKGIKESTGDFILTFENDSLNIDENFIVDSIKKKKYVVNDREMRKELSPKIAYIVPGIGISGGIAIVLNHTNHLLERGYDVCIISHNPDLKTDWFHNSTPIVHSTTKQQYLLDNIDILIATHWSTAFYMDLLPSRRKVYFVQSDERRFNPENKSEIKSIEATYKINSEHMTEAIWIQRWLKEEFGHDAYYVPNGLDLNVFHSNDVLGQKGTKTRVLLEGPINVWFKGMDDAYNVVKDIDCEIWIISSNGKPKDGWHCDRFFEKVAMDDMQKIYSSCDIFLKMSRAEGFFGPPMEAMACGCAVVAGKVTGYDEYIKDGENALVVEMGDVNGAKKAIQKLIGDKSLREKLIENGHKTAKEWNWEKSIDLLEKVIKNDPVKKFYTNTFPEKYNYQKEKKKMKNYFIPA